MESSNCPICSKALVKAVRWINLWVNHHIQRCPAEKDGDYHYFNWICEKGEAGSIDVFIEEYRLRNFRAVVYTDDSRTALYSYARADKEQLIKVYHRSMTCDELCRLDRVWSLA